MNVNEYKKLHDAESTYWWHVGRLKIIHGQIKKLQEKGLLKFDAAILNVGAGTGGTIPTLEKFGTVMNVDTSDQAIRFIESGGHHAKLIDGSTLPFKDSTFDMVVALDVMEHIEDDAAALKEWLRVIKPGGMIFITVPAYQWLWSDHDVVMHHYRRYSTGQIRSLTKAYPVKIIKLSYMIVFSLPLIIAYRLARNLTNPRASRQKSSIIKVPALVNSFFIMMLSIEARALRLVDALFGTSILLVARKTDL